MPSPRRFKLIALAAVTIILVLWYHKTSNGVVRRDKYMDTLKAQKAHGDEREFQERAAIAERLKEAEGAAKRAAGIKGGLKPDSPKQVEKVMKGRVSSEDGVERDDGPAPAPAAPGPKTTSYDSIEDLAAILKKSPIVIFSKTYCEFSRRAKDLLLHRYMIVPKPFVVELDVHPHGRLLQEALWKQTGRKTVPNIIIGAESIGGSDEIQSLEEQGILADTIHRLAGKHIQRMLKLKD